MVSADILRTWWWPESWSVYRIRIFALHACVVGFCVACMRRRVIYIYIYIYIYSKSNCAVLGWERLALLRVYVGRQLRIANVAFCKYTCDCWGLCDYGRVVAAAFMQASGHMKSKTLIKFYRRRLYAHCFSCVLYVWVSQLMLFCFWELLVAVWRRCFVSRARG